MNGEKYLSHDWSDHVFEADECLSVSRKKFKPNGAFAPNIMTPDDVDFEMSFGKSRKVLQIYGMRQDCLEYFVEKYGEEYEYLSFYQSPLISDFSPLEKLENLQAVHINWNIRASTLWDMSHNPKLESLWLNSAKKITYNPLALQKAKSLKDISFIGNVESSSYPMQSLEWMRGMESLENVYLRNIRLENRDASVLDSVPRLRRFDFPAGMFTTEEIAYMCAKHPYIEGDSLRAYNTDDVLHDVRICGYKKPGLNLPKNQAAFEKYIKQFDALVEQYKAELKNGR